MGTDNNTTLKRGYRYWISRADDKIHKDLRGISEVKYLIIDDEDFARSTLRRLIMDKDVKIFEADNAYDGYALARNEKPDIIFCDIMMQNIGGDWLIGRLLSTMPNANIIVVSGKPKEELLKYKLLGVKAVITKPINYNLLIKEIDAIRNLK